MSQTAKHWLPSALALGLGAILALPAGAQEASDESGILEEVIVTATKRDLSLQEVPLSINAISGEVLEQFSISNFYDMDIPGVNIAQGGMNDNAFIRGIGQSSGNFGFENSAPYYIDGVYYGRARGTRLAWLDPERVEVIKGPVPTYLGKNASAGGISIISRRPTDELDGYLNLGQEFEHNETAVTGAVSGPLGDGFRARLAAKYRNLRDGWMTNTYTDVGEPKQEDLLFRLSAEMDLADNFSAYAKLETVNAKWEGRNTQQFACGPTARIDPAFEDCEFNETRALHFDPANHPTGIWDRELPVGTNFLNDFEYFGGALTLNWQLEGASITSTTAYYDFENQFFADASHSTDDRAMANFNESFNQFSQEARIQSEGGGALDWMAGVYYDTNDNVNSTKNSLPAAMGMIVLRDNDEQADSFGVFGEVAYNFSEQWRAVVGGRYSEYDKDNVYDQVIRVNLVPGRPYTDAMVAAAATFSIPNSQSDSKFQPSVGLEWRPNGDTMYFATYKQGFKAGGLDHQATANNPERQRIEAEEVDAFEVGAKWTLANGAARLNLSYFRANYTNLQVSLFDPIATAFVTSNAGEATTQGIEMDAQWALSDNFRASAYLSYLNAEYDDYRGVNCYLNPRQTEAQGCVTLLDANGNPTGSRGQDLSGTPLQFAPDISGTISLDYNAPFGDGMEFFGTLSLFFTDDYQITANGDPDLVQEGYSKLDLRTGVGAADQRWQLALVARNLTDKQIFEWASDTPLGGGASHFGLLKRTRQIALQAVMRFGK